MSAKRRLFAMIPALILLLNMDDPYYADMRRGCNCNILTYGTSDRGRL